MAAKRKHKKHHAKKHKKHHAKKGGHVPLTVLKKRLARLTNIVKARS